MSNEIIAVSIPQMDDDIDIFEDLKAIMMTRGFNFVDMCPEFNTECITYRFQRKDESTSWPS